MPILPSVQSYILSEETDTESPVSEQTMQKLGQSINFLNDRFQLSQTVFNSSGTFTPPEGVDTVMVIGCGGGGSGVSATLSNKAISGFGAPLRVETFSVTPLIGIAISIGSGGSGGNDGGTSLFGANSFIGGSGGGLLNDFSSIGSTAGSILNPAPTNFMATGAGLLKGFSAPVGQKGGFTLEHASSVAAGRTIYSGAASTPGNKAPIPINNGDFSNIYRGGSGHFGLGGAGSAGVGSSAGANTGAGGGNGGGGGGNGGSGKIIVIF